MKCKSCSKPKCGCKFNLSCHGTCDTCKIAINGVDVTQLNWNEVSVPEIMTIPEQKPDIEHLDHVYVEAKIDCVNLIETPFAYQVYERAATAFELTTATTIINLAVVDVQPIIDAANAILAIPGLPAIPAVVAFQQALDAITAAATNLTNAINTALTTIANAPCLSAAALLALIEAVVLAVQALIIALNLLSDAGAVLVTATAGIPIVGAAVAAAVAALDTAINLVITTLQTALTALLDFVGLIGVTTYFAIIPNEEGTCLTGRKLIVEGTLKQKIVYTGLVDTQSVHSAHCEIPFTAYVIPYANFTGLEMVPNVTVLAGPDTCETLVINGFPYDPNQEIMVDLCEDFCVNVYIEDIFAYVMDPRRIFKNITLFLKATPAPACQ